MPDIHIPELPEKPPLTIKIGDREIKMTYGLELDIRRMIGNDPSTALILMQNDQNTQDYVVRRVLTPTNSLVTKEDQLIPVDSVDISSDEVEEILNWATEHTLYFFVKRAVGLGKLGVRYQEALRNPSTTGSENSATTTPSAGPSDA